MGKVSWYGNQSRRRKTVFKPVKLRLKIDLVSHLVHVEGLVNTYTETALSWFITTFAHTQQFPNGNHRTGFWFFKIRNSHTATQIVGWSNRAIVLWESFFIAKTTLSERGKFFGINFAQIFHVPRLSVKMSSTVWWFNSSSVILTIKHQ